MVALLFAVLLAALPGTAARGQAATYTLFPDGSGDFPTIQAAIDAAGEGDLIELADGTYTGDGNRDLDFLGKAITVRSASGDPAQCILQCGGSSAHPHRGVHFHQGEGSGTVLEAITIWGAWSGQTGGAILCDGAAPALNGCMFEFCYAKYGGGIGCLNGAAPTITNCTLRDSQALAGGGFYCRGATSPLLTGCTLARNHATGSPPLGGGFCSDGGSPILEDCTFSRNEVEGWGACGGGLYAGSGGALELRACAFRRNSAYAYASGGGVYCNGSALLIEGGEFWHNYSENEGGGLTTLNCAPVIEGVVFSENSSIYGAAIHACSATLELTGATLLANSAPGGGAALCLGCAATATLANCLAAFNGSGNAIHCASGALATLTCCNLFGNEDGNWTAEIAAQLGSAGNICLDPQFCSLAPWDDENWELQSDSPCAPEHSGCGLIGAGPVGCDETPVLPVSWGRVKVFFR